MSKILGVCHMLNTVLKFAKENRMINPNDTVVIGVSGGADSVCLLLLLKEMQKFIDFNVVAVHVNHCIRGEEADSDQEFVRALCERYHITLLSFSIDVKKIAEKERISVEEAGRKARYSIFEQVLSDYAKPDSGKIAVAHHMDDQSETILMNLLRGSGMKGLCGMQPVRDHIIRPLLCVRRKDIENYLKETGQGYRIDSTNLENDYTRNRIRNEVFPYLEEHVNHHAVENVCGMAQVISEAQEYLERQALDAQQKCLSINNKNKHIINIGVLNQFDAVIKKYVIRNILGNLAGHFKDLYKVHIDSVLDLVDKGVGSQIDLFYGIVAKRGYHEIIFERKLENTERSYFIDKDIKKDIFINEEVIYEVGINDEFYVKGNQAIFLNQIEFIKLSQIENIIGNDYTKMFDYDKIKFTLQIRTRKTGDYIQINEHGGNKKLKDFFIDNKVPKEERDRVLLLADGNHILWIIGFRMSEAYKVTDDTKNYLKVRIVCGG